MRRYTQWLTTKDLALSIPVNFVLIVLLSVSTYYILKVIIERVTNNPTLLWPIGFFGLVAMGIAAFAPRPGRDIW